MMFFLTSKNYSTSTTSMSVFNNDTNEETSILDITKEVFEGLSVDDRQVFLVIIRMNNTLTTEQKNAIIERMGIVNGVPA